MEHFFDKTSKKCLELAKNMFYKWKEKEIKSNSRRQPSQLQHDGMRQSSSSTLTVVVDDGSDQHDDSLNRSDNGSSRPGKRISSRRQAAAVDSGDDDGATASAAALMRRRKRRAFEIQTPAYERQIRARNRSITYRRRPVRRLEFSPNQQSFISKAPSAVIGATSSPIYYGSPRAFQVRTMSIRALPADDTTTFTKNNKMTIKTNSQHQQRQIIIPQRRHRQQEASKVVNVDRCGILRADFECFDEFSDDGFAGRLSSRVRRSTGVADSPILVDSVKIVVQEPTKRVEGNVFKRRESSKMQRVKKNPCIIRDEENIITLTSSEAPKSSKPSTAASDSRKQSRRFISGASNTSILEDECCENLINERLELRAVKTSNSNLCHVRSEWDDDDDEDSARGAVGGPVISASIRV